MSFDDELRRALGREEPPPGFADRTLARLSEAPGRSSGAEAVGGSSSWRSVRWVVLPVAASLAIAAGAGLMLVRRQAAQDGERAKRQVELALRITSEALSEVRTKVEDRSRQ